MTGRSLQKVCHLQNYRLHIQIWIELKQVEMISRYIFDIRKNAAKRKTFFPDECY